MYRSSKRLVVLTGLSVPIGCSTDPVEIEKLVSQAQCEKERIYGPTLFDPRPVEDLKNVTNDCIRVIGTDLVFSELLKFRSSLKC